MKERLYLTKEQALSALPEGENVHCFVSGGGILFGADWNRKQVEQYIEEADSVVIGGGMSRRMGHGLAVFGTDGLKFFEAKEEALQKLEKEVKDELAR
jgi:hypothetical protein